MILDTITTISYAILVIFAILLVIGVAGKLPKGEKIFAYTIVLAILVVVCDRVALL